MATYEHILTPPTVLVNGVALATDIVKVDDNNFTNNISNLNDDTARVRRGTATIEFTTTYTLETDPQKVFGSPNGYLGGRAVIFFTITGKNPTESIDNMYDGHTITATNKGITFTQDGKAVTWSNSGQLYTIKARVKYMGKWSKTTKVTIRVT